MFDSLKMKVLVSVIGVIGVGGAAFASGVIQVPQAGLADKGDWSHMTENSVNVTTTGYVNNPNSFGINLSSLDATYRLKMNGLALAKGSKEGLVIEEDKNQTISVNTRLMATRIPDWWSTHLKREEESRLEVPLTIELKLFSLPIKISGYSYEDTIETDLESKMDEAVSQMKGTYSWSLTDAEFSETHIEVKEGSANFGETTSDKTSLIVDLEVHNPNSHPIPTPQFNGNLKMNDVMLAEWKANDVTVLKAPSSGKIDAGEKRNLKLKVMMSNEKIDEWFISHVKQKERTNGTVDLRMGFELAGQRLTFPPGGMSCGFNFQTGILVDSQSSASSFSGCNYAPRESKNSSGSEIIDQSPLKNSRDNDSDSSENSYDNISDKVDSIL